MDNIDFSLMSIQNKIPSETVYLLREKMIKKGIDNSAMAIARANLRDPIITLVFALLLGGFGVHRFYLGDNGMGCGFIAGYVISTVLFIAGLFVGFPLVIVAILGYVGMGIWQLIDIFMSFKRAKTVNFNRINYMLDMMKDV